MSLFATAAIRDIIPIHPEPYPREIVNYVLSLHSSSKHTLHLSPNEEPARHHLSALVVIEHFQHQHHFPDPLLSKIPLPTRRIHALLPSFRSFLLGMLQSTPVSKSKSKSKVLNFSYTPQTESYIDKIRQKNQLDVDSAKKSLSDQLSKEISLTPPSTPSTKSPLSKSSPKRTPLSPYKSRKKTVITTPILVSFCNKFYIPQHITAHILRSFKLYQHIVSNSWGLLVGLVGISYLQLNKSKLSAGLKKALIASLHNLQQGALSIIEVKNYILQITRLISSQKWIKEASFDMDGPSVQYPSSASSSSASLNSFLDPAVNYVTRMHSKQVLAWTKRIAKTR